MGLSQLSGKERSKVASNENCFDMLDKSIEKEMGMRMPVECFTRVVGYLRPRQSFNVAKQLEFDQRVTYDIGKAVDKANKIPYNRDA